MKKQLAMIVAACLLPLLAQARVIDRAEAQAMAQEFWSQSTGSRATGMTLSRALPAQEQMPFYFFTPESGRGFVIISGDDCAGPVLGYSLSDPASGPMPPALEAMLGQFAQWVASDQARSASRASGPERPLRAPAEAVLWETAKWNQTAPYNLSCPMYQGKHCLTGCTQTGTAIVMRFFKWPPAPVGTLPGYTTSLGIYVPQIELKGTYDWDNMPLNYNNGYNQAQGNAVAKLMVQLGTAFGADYGLDATSASIKLVRMFENFGYSPQAHYVRKDDYSSNAWYQMIKKEVAKYPIPYRGSRGEGGHLFVLDGFNEYGYFHVNWGWGGVDDGYFDLSSLNGYDDDQWAVIGLSPNYEQTTQPSNWISFNPDNKFLAPDCLTYNSFEISGLNVTNATVMYFDGCVRVAHVDRNGRIKGWVSKERAIRLNSGHSYKFSIYVDIVEKREVGDRLWLYYKAVDQNDWTRIISDSGAQDELFLADQYTIQESTSVAYKPENGTLEVKSKNGVSISFEDESGMPFYGPVQSPFVSVSLSDFPSPAAYLHITKGEEDVRVRINVKRLEK